MSKLHFYLIICNSTKQFLADTCSVYRERKKWKMAQNEMLQNKIIPYNHLLSFRQILFSSLTQNIVITFIALLFEARACFYSMIIMMIWMRVYMCALKFKIRVNTLICFERIWNRIYYFNFYLNILSNNSKWERRYTNISMFLFAIFIVSIYLNIQGLNNTLVH